MTHDFVRISELICGHAKQMPAHAAPVFDGRIKWYDAEDRRFIRSGDTGRFDDDGFLILLDRKKDMIISGGFNVYPSDIETVMRAHPGVADVAVFGIPCERWGPDAGRLSRDARRRHGKRRQSARLVRRPARQGAEAPVARRVRRPRANPLNPSANTQGIK